MNDSSPLMRELMPRNLPRKTETCPLSEFPVTHRPVLMPDGTTRKVPTNETPASARRRWYLEQAKGKPRQALRHRPRAGAKNRNGAPGHRHAVKGNPAGRANPA